MLNDLKNSIILHVWNFTNHLWSAFEYTVSPWKFTGARWQPHWSISITSSWTWLTSPLVTFCHFLYLFLQMKCFFSLDIYCFLYLYLIWSGDMVFKKCLNYLYSSCVCGFLPFHAKHLMWCGSLQNEVPVYVLFLPLEWSSKLQGPLATAQSAVSKCEVNKKNQVNQCKCSELFVCFVLWNSLSVSHISSIY